MNFIEEHISQSQSSLMKIKSRFGIKYKRKFNTNNLTGLGIDYSHKRNIHRLLINIITYHENI